MSYQDDVDALTSYVGSLVDARHPVQDVDEQLLQKHNQHVDHTLDLAMRTYAHANFLKAPDALKEKLPYLLDLAIRLAGDKLLDVSTPFVLLSETLESHLISSCEQLFHVVEERAAQLAKLMAVKATARLTFIKTCTELLGRLSKSMNTNFCGRILMLLAYTLPLSERSGVNLKGAYAPYQLDLATDEEVASSGIDAGEDAGEDGPYSSFWGLQKAFCDPGSAVSEEEWPSLLRRLDHVLQMMSANVGQGLEGRDDDVDADGMAIDGEGESTREVYFAKFLTSPKLLPLQLRDAYFRRHVLVQLAIFFQTITTEGKLRAPQLSREQLDDVERLRARCTELLVGIAPHGAEFAGTLDGLLQRERTRIEWKKAGCPTFERAAQEVSDAPAASRRAIKKRGGPQRDEADGGARRAERRRQLGNANLSRLWALMGNSLDELVASGKGQGVSPLSLYVAPVIEQLAPDAGIEEEYMLKHDKVHTWKTLNVMNKEDRTVVLECTQNNLFSLEEAAKLHHLKSGGDAVWSVAADDPAPEGSGEVPEAGEGPEGGDMEAEPTSTAAAPEAGT